MEWAAAGACGPRVTGAGWSHVTDGPGPVRENRTWCVGGSVTGAMRRGGERVEHMGGEWVKRTNGSEGLQNLGVRL